MTVKHVSRIISSVELQSEGPGREEPPSLCPPNHCFCVFAPFHPDLGWTHTQNIMLPLRNFTRAPCSSIRCYWKRPPLGYKAVAIVSEDLRGGLHQCLSSFNQSLLTWELALTCCLQARTCGPASPARSLASDVAGVCLSCGSCDTSLQTRGLKATYIILSVWEARS